MWCVFLLPAKLGQRLHRQSSIQLGVPSSKNKSSLNLLSPLQRPLHLGMLNSWLKAQLLLGRLPAADQAGVQVGVQVGVQTEVQTEVQAKV